MCGIAGLFQASAPVARDQLAPLEVTLRHRGPDYFGVFHEGPFGCAHNRLSILDLSAAGNQPVVSDRYVLAYNGEVYNWRALRAELEGLGHRFVSVADTEVVFRALSQWGVAETLAKLRGMFAFSWYDRQQRRLVLARDRIGIKPLFWTWRGRSLYFASEVKALANFVEVAVDPIRTLYGVASIGDRSQWHTPFRNVYHVPPGSFLSLSEGSEPELTRYFDLLDLIDPSLYRRLARSRFRDVTAELNDLLSASISSMSVTDAPLGCFVSGGVDSSLVASMATRKLGGLDLFSADVVGRFSEIRDATQLCQHLGQPLHIARFHARDFLRDLAQATLHYEAPLVSHVNSVPFAAVAREAHARGVKAVLTGEGSDELFLGYPKLAAEKYRRPLAQPVEAMKSLYGVLPGLREYVFPDAGASVPGFLELLVQSFERQRFRREGLLRLSFLPRDDQQEQYMSVQMLKEGLISLLHRNDRMGMLASIESRFPFLDEEVLRFGVNLPAHMKIRRSWRVHDKKHPFLTDKAPVRACAADWVPRSLAFKSKNGFPSYGLAQLNVPAAYFEGGFVQELLDAPREAIEYAVSAQPPYFVGKLVAVDVFGRLFDRSESVADVRERLIEHVELTA
jgi:asparagine synthase (glutamine-hydrolysing)